MAGKHSGGIRNTGLQQAGSSTAMAAFRPEFPGSRCDRAFAEARVLKIKVPATTLGNNPYASPTAEYYAWVNGYSSYLNDAATGLVQTHFYINPEPPN